MPQVLIKSRDPMNLEGKRMIIRFTSWPRWSPFPLGQFVKIIGPEEKVSTETAMILHEFNIDTRPFS